MAWDGIERRGRQLTDDDVEALTTAIASKMMSHGCPLNDKQRDAVPELYNIFRDMGGGEISKGIMVFRDLLRFLAGMHSKRTLVGSVTIGLMVVGIMGWLITASLTGIWNAIAERIVP